MNPRALTAEFIGTFAIIFVGCGTALFSGPTLFGPGAAAGSVGVAFAFGLAFVALAFALGHVSGGHFNPAVTIGLVAGGRFPVVAAPPYIAAQVLGAITATGALAVVISGAPAGPNAIKLNDMLAISNHFGGKGEFSFFAAFALEFLMAALLLIIIIGSTSKRAPAGFAPIAIGLAIVFFHLLAFPVTNASLNPARATGPALFAGGKALGDLWLFWAAPIFGAAVGGLVARWTQVE